MAPINWEFITMFYLTIHFLEDVWVWWYIQGTSMNTQAQIQPIANWQRGKSGRQHKKVHTACAHTYTYTYTYTHNKQKRKHTDANRPNHCRNTANDHPTDMLKKCALPYTGLSTVVIYSCDQEQAGTSLIMRWAQCPAHSPPGATRCHQGNQHHHRLHHHQVGWGTLLHQDNQHHHITITTNPVPKWS